MNLLKISESLNASNFQIPHSIHYLICQSNSFWNLNGSQLSLLENLLSTIVFKLFSVFFQFFFLKRNWNSAFKCVSKMSAETKDLEFFLLKIDHWNIVNKLCSHFLLTSVQWFKNICHQTLWSWKFFSFLAVWTVFVALLCVTFCIKNSLNFADNKTDFSWQWININSSEYFDLHLSYLAISIEVSLSDEIF